MNFDLLKRDDGYYDLFADACIEAEKVYATSPAMCAVGVSLCSYRACCTPAGCEDYKLKVKDLTMSSLGIRIL